MIFGPVDTVWATDRAPAARVRRVMMTIRFMENLGWLICLTGIPLLREQDGLTSASPAGCEIEF